MGFGHDRMPGGVLAFRYSLGGMGVGDGSPGLVDGGDGLTLCRQVAQVEGDSLRSCGHCRPAGEDRPFKERVPCGCIGPACVGSLGVAEPIGDGLGRVTILFRQLEVLLEGAGGGEKGPGILFHVWGHGGIP